MYFKKKYKIRDEEREKVLMTLISKADDMMHVNKEFTELWDRTSPPIHGGLIKKFLPPQENIENVEEGFAEGWLKVVVNRKYYDSNFKPFPWLFTIFLNTTTNWVNKINNYSKQFSPISYLQNNSEKIDQSFLLNGRNALQTSEQPIVYSIMQSKVFDKLLNEAIQKLLDEREKDVFIKYIYKDKTYHQIKDELQLSLGTVSKVFKSAVNKIQEFLTQHDFDWKDYVRSLSIQ